MFVCGKDFYYFDPVLIYNIKQFQSCLLDNYIQEQKATLLIL